MPRRFVTSILAMAIVAGCGASGGTSAPSDSAATSAAPTAEALSPSPEATTEAVWQLVAVGDSILFNSPDDCPGCTGAVDRYATAVTAATGRTVNVRNLTQHNGLQVDDLLNELERDATRKGVLAAADIILVGIAHNDAPMNRDDDPCDGAGGDSPDWTKFTDECIAEDVAMFTPKYESVFEQIAAMRTGKPTILRLINRYNDWIGWPGHDLSADGIIATSAVVAAWNDMICRGAEAHAFRCADVSAKFNGANGREPAGDLLGADYTHPSDKGNEVIARVLADLGFAPLPAGPG